MAFNMTSTYMDTIYCICIQRYKVKELFYCSIEKNAIVNIYTLLNMI